MPKDAYRHLAVAAGELARESGVSALDRARFAKFEAQWRDLSDAPSPQTPGLPLRCLELADTSEGRRAWRFPPRQIDRGLVEEVKDVLRSLGSPAATRAVCC